MFRQGPSACGFRPAGLPEGSGLKPLSARAGARLCVSFEGVLPDSNRRPIAWHAMALPTELKTRIPTSACAPRSLRRLLGHEIRHADCLSPTGYSTECQDAGLPPEPPHSARGRSLVRLALPRTTRCPSRLAMSVSRIAPPRVLSRARIPNRSWCVSSILPRIACTAIPAAFQRGREGRACLDGPNPKVRRDAMGSAPFPPLPAVIRRQAAIPLRPKPKGVVRSAEAEWTNQCVRTGAQERAEGTRGRLARRETLPRHITQSPLSKNIQQGNKKALVVFEPTRAFRADPEGSVCKPSRPVVIRRLTHVFLAIESMPFHEHAARPQGLRPCEPAARG